MLYVPNRKLCVCDTCLTQNSILQAQGFQIALSINLEKLSLTLFPCNIQMTFICRIYSHRHTQIMCCNLEESLHVISNFQLASFNYTHMSSTSQTPLQKKVEHDTLCCRFDILSNVYIFISISI